MKNLYDADRIIGIRLANIFKGLSQINDEVSTLDTLNIITMPIKCPNGLADIWKA